MSQTRKRSQLITPSSDIKYKLEISPKVGISESCLTIAQTETQTVDKTKIQNKIVWVEIENLAKSNG